MFIHHPLISFVVVRSLRMKKKEQWHASHLSFSSPLSLSFAFRGHWSRLTDGSRQKKRRRKMNANRLSKESNTLTARRRWRRQEKEKKKKTTLTPRPNTHTSAFIVLYRYSREKERERETNKWSIDWIFIFSIYQWIEEEETTLVELVIFEKICPLNPSLIFPKNTHTSYSMIKDKERYLIHWKYRDHLIYLDISDRCILKWTDFFNL